MYMDANTAERIRCQLMCVDNVLKRAQLIHAKWDIPLTDELCRCA